MALVDVRVRSPFAEAVTDIVAGTLGGMATVIIGYDMINTFIENMLTNHIN